MFRRSERWLHQHIFKVGWLISNNFQTATALYCIFFLPGILLRELALWLAATLLRVRTERAIRFPQTHELGEPRLKFVRLPDETRSLRHALIKLAPVVAGLALLWAIATQVFDWQEAARLAASGSIDDLAQAISRLLRTADFWLWFYLAFAIANTMFPAQLQTPGARRKAALSGSAGASVLIIWRLAGEIDGGAQFVESLVGNLVLVLLQIIAFNLVSLLALGSLEALIERASGKSASFVDGKLVAMSRQEAQARRAMEGRVRREARQNREITAPAKVIASVYELKLPIPGPPGREPISRSAVSVVNVREDATDDRPRPNPVAKPARKIVPPTVDVERPKSADKVQTVSGGAKPVPQRKPASVSSFRQPADRETRDFASAGDEGAPFNRPFVGAASNRGEGEVYPGDPEEQRGGGQFQRPFALQTRAQPEPEIGDSPPIAASAVDTGAAAQRRGKPLARKQASKTRPAPKPSARNRKKPDEPAQPDQAELSYEPLDADDDYPADDEL